MAKRVPLVVVSEPSTDGVLRVVRVEPGCVTMSTGEVLLVRYAKLESLAEQLCQDCSPVTMRTWWTPDGVELVEIHRVTSTPPAPIEPSEPTAF